MCMWYVIWNVRVTCNIEFSEVCYILKRQLVCRNTPRVCVCFPSLLPLSCVCVLSFSLASLSCVCVLPFLYVSLLVETRCLLSICDMRYEIYMWYVIGDSKFANVSALAWPNHLFVKASDEARQERWRWRMSFYVSHIGKSADVGECPFTYHI